MLFEHFDAVRIINLKHRADRRAQMQDELRRLGADADPRVAFFDACRFDTAGTFTSIGARGVYHSHLTILEEAAARGTGVLILEDDVDFTAAAGATALPSGWQIFYGGHYAAQPHDLHNSGIIGAHCMGFRADVIPALAVYLRGLLALDDHPPIDGAYVWFRRAHPDVVTHFAVPPIANQRPSRTDIAAQRFFDRWPGLREAAGLARRGKRLAARDPAAFRRRALLLGLGGGAAAALLAVALA
jgi:glycosyl transferase family 25